MTDQKPRVVIQTQYKVIVIINFKNFHLLISCIIHKLRIALGYSFDGRLADLCSFYCIDNTLREKIEIPVKATSPQS